MKTLIACAFHSLFVVVLSGSTQLQAARLSEAFNPNANPTGPWSLGGKSAPNETFNLYAARYAGSAGGSIIAYWGAASQSEPWIRRNQGPEEFTVNGQGHFKVGAISAGPGPFYHPLRYAVARYTAPADGVYRFAVSGESTGWSDVDVDVRLNDGSLVNGNLATGGTLGLTNELFLNAGTVLDVVTGPGADGSNYGAVFQFDIQVDLIADTNSVPVAITFTPPSGSYGEPVSVSLQNQLATGEIRYTVDGSTPTATSALYESPLLISSSSSRILAAVFNNGERVSPVYLATYRVEPGSGLPFASGLSSVFSSAGNPRDRWTLGYKETWQGRLTPYTAQYQGGYLNNVLEYWGYESHTESWIRQNTGPAVFTVPGQGQFPVRGLSAAPGFEGRPDQYATARYTVPSNGWYRVKILGYSSGITDVDVRIIQDGVLLSGGNVEPEVSTGWSENVVLTAGTMIDLAVGRGQRRSNYGAVFQFDMQVEALTEGGDSQPAIRLTPSRGRFTNDLVLALVKQVPDGEIRYTLDGTAPSAGSPLYQAPITLTASAAVRAQLFKDGVPVSMVYGAAYQKLDAASDGIPITWYLHYFGANAEQLTGLDDEGDADDDGSSNLREYLAGTDPSDPLSGFGVGIKSVPCVIFKSVPGQEYRILRSTSPAAPGVEISRVRATSTQTSFADGSLTAGNGFYSVEAVR